MATVVIQKRKRKNGVSYLVSYRDPVSGRKKHYKTFHRQKDAQRAANELRALIDSGRMSDVQRHKAKLAVLTFAEVSGLLNQEWIKRFNRDELRKKTLEEYHYRSELLNRTFGKRLLCEISEEDILSYRWKVASEFSNVTSNRSLFVIKQVFKHGLKIQAVFDDPAARVSYLSEKEHERNRFLLPGELHKLIDASRKTKAKYYMPALICLGAEHGTSRQEALSLEWSDIDFDYEGQGIIRFFRAKNSRERTEYLMPMAKQALSEWLEHQHRMRRRKRIERVKSNLVFCRHDGEPIKRFDKAWKAACEIAGIQDFHFHDLRHTFCSNLLLSGANLKDVKDMIGHSDLAMTDRYSHLTLHHKRLRQNKLAEHYGHSSR